MPRGVAVALAIYGVVLVVTMGPGMTQATESPLPDPAGMMAADSDAGVNHGRYAATAPVAEGACPECAVELSSADSYALLSHMAWKPSLFISSTAAHVYDESCGQHLWGKNEDKRLPPASLTKMMTALVVMEQVPDLDRRVQVNLSGQEMAVRTNSSVMGLEPGMDVSIRDLLYGLMLPSGNDASIVLAEAVSGNVDAFVALMNEKVAQMGLVNTRFANTHGLDNPGLYSTAADLTVIGQAVMAHPVLAEVVRAGSYTVAGGMGLNNGNRMLGSFPGTYGVKIGYTRRASHTITVAAERDGRRIYASVLGSHTPYVDARMLLDWAFTHTRC